MIYGGMTRQGTLFLGESSPPSTDGQMDNLAIQVNLRHLKMGPTNFSCQKLGIDTKMLKTKVTNMAILLAKMAIIGQSRQNEFLKPKTIGINTKVKSLACSNQKLPINGHLATPVILRGMNVISMNFSFPKNRE